LTFPAADGKGTGDLSLPSSPVETDMDSFFVFITAFGSLTLLAPSSILLCLILFRTARQREALLLAASLAVTVIAVHLAKLFFQRPRPKANDLLVSMPSDWSFPSAHTAQATAFFFALSLIAVRILPPFWAVVTTVFSLLIVCGVAYSRIYLQVHYPSDVLAGLALAILLVLVVQALVTYVYPPPKI
jgi:undecaprenyl-diphosphatase